MRVVTLAFVAVLSAAALAQPVLKATQVAEFADRLSQPHDAAFSPDGKLVYLTDMRKSRMRVLVSNTRGARGSPMKTTTESCSSTAATARSACWARAGVAAAPASSTSPRRFSRARRTCG